MTHPDAKQPDDEQTPAPAEVDEVPASIFTEREVPTKTRRTLWAVGGAVGVGYILYGLWQMFTGS